MVRVAIDADTASETRGSESSYVSGVITSGAGGNALRVSAANPGEWGNALEFGVDHNGTETLGGHPIAFNLVVRERHGRRVTRSEVFRNLNNSDRTNVRFAPTVVAASSLVDVASLNLGLLPAKTHTDAVAAAGDVDDTQFVPLHGGTDGVVPQPATGGPSQWIPRGPGAILDAMRRLDRIAPSIFNLMCIPAAATFDDAGTSGWCRTPRCSAATIAPS